MLKLIKGLGLNPENFVISSFYSLVVAPIMGLIFPIQHLLTPLIGLVVLDIITGIIKSRVFKKEPITSTRFKEKLKPLFLWSLGVVSMLIADIFLKEVGIENHWAAKIYCVFYALYETISILENLGESGLPGAKAILQLLRGKLPSNLTDALEKAKEDENKK